MPPYLVLALAVCFVVYAIREDRKRTPLLSNALFWPTLWYVVAATRPIGVWFVLWKLPLFGSESGDATDGSPIDRMFYGVLSLIGFYVLSRRRVRWAVLIRENMWLAVLLGYLFLSVGWSDYPMVSFKRLVKVIGAIVMALVILTEPDRAGAITAVLRRGAYVCIPLSIVAIRYFRDIGVSWDYMGTSSSWQGVSNSKNVLGEVAATSGLVFIWERARRAKIKQGRWVDYLLIAMSVYLLKGEEGRISMTAITVFALGFGIFFGFHVFKNRPGTARLLFRATISGIMVLLLLVIVHSVSPFPEHSMFGSLITTFGRDITLTGRTEIWNDVYHVAARDPLFGIGFGGFWIGRIANIPWNENMSWILGQGHDGYVDVYLQLGWCGILLFFATLFACASKINRSLETDFDYARFRAVFFCVIIYVNITESTFLRGEHNLWLVFLLIALNVPTYAFDYHAPPAPVKADANPADEMDEESMRGPAVFP
jgi:exopolysaccharide production protein ExoQ